MTTENLEKLAVVPRHPPPPLKAFNAAEFLSLKIPPREDILSPILQTQSLNMIYAPRGIGKTFTAMGIGYAIAAGGKFLRWEAPKPRRVLYLDGEMPASTMQTRLAEIIKQSSKESAPEDFCIITPDMQEMGMPDISTSEGRAMVEPFIAERDFIIVDNLSTLARTGKENEGESWLPVQGWALDMRSRGKSVLFVHHAGKGGQQRGTSRKEDVLDLVMNLKRPEDYDPQNGARFEVHFEKARHLVGDAAKPFEASLTAAGWAMRSIEDAELQKVLALKKEGMSVRDIAEETKISKSRVNRMVKGNV